MLLMGTLQILAFTALIVYWDDDSSAMKLCHHYSISDLKILQEYRVKTIPLKKKLLFTVLKLNSAV